MTNSYPEPIVSMAVGAFIVHGSSFLAVEPTYKSTWEIPGGMVEKGESPCFALIREITEELGISPTVGRLLAFEFQKYPENDVGSLQMIFEVKLSEKDIEKINLDPMELKSSRFVSVSEFEELAVARLSRRVKFAYLALQTGETIYLENGANLSDLKQFT